MGMQHFYYQIKQKNNVIENFHLYMDSDYFLEFYSDMLARGSDIKPLEKGSFSPIVDSETYSKVPLELTGTDLPGYIEHYEVNNRIR